MPDSPLLTRRVDLRGGAAFARGLVTALRQVPGLDVLAALRSGVRATCPQCGLRLLGEEVLALGGTEAPQPDISPKLHRLSQGFCGRQGCESLFHEYTFEPVAGVDWDLILAGLAGAPETGEADAVIAAAGGSPPRPRVRTRMRVALGVGLVLVLLLVRHLMTGGTIPLLREADQFNADPKTVPRLGETNTTPPPPRAGTNANPGVFRAGPPAGTP